MNRVTRRSAARRAFTFVEVILAVVLVVAIVTLAWPVVRGALRINRLRSAAETLSEQISTARINAISSGKIHMLRVDPLTDRYVIEPLEDYETALESALAEDQFGKPSELQAAPTEENEHHLPGGVVFDAVDLQKDQRRGMALMADPDQNDFANEIAPSLLFYPDGTASSARVILRDKDRRVEITISGLTGAVHVHEPYKAGEDLQVIEEGPASDEWIDL